MAEVTSASSTTNKLDYLKRYLSDDKPGTGKKKKKRIKLAASLNFRKSKIVDDDIDLKAIGGGDSDVEPEFGDEQPMVVGVVDERPLIVRTVEEFRQSDKWRVLGSQENHENKDQNKRHDSDSDIDESPVRRTRHDSDSDSSPIRPSVTYDSDPSPPRRPSTIQVGDGRRESDGDQSPPRRRQRRRSKSPTGSRERGSDSDLSPQRTSRNNGSRGKSRDSHRKYDDRRVTAKPTVLEVPDPKGTRMTRTLEGRIAGLQDAKALRDENKAMQEKERRMFATLDDEVSGRNAKTVHRDRKSGKRRDLEEEERVEAEKNARQAALNEKYSKWSKGLKQQEMQQSRLENDLHEMSKPLARYSDDADLDKALREELKDGDPMLEFMKKKREKQKKKEGAQRPTYQGPAPPPNRYNIPPGYRWDGVDRSNGFEKSRVTRMNNKIANEEQAYKWSVEDM